MIHLLVVDVSSQVAGPGTILGAGALTYHTILIYNTTLTCPKQLKSHIDTATKTCGKSSASQCKHAHSSTSMLHCPHASERETQPSDWVCGTCNTKRHGCAGRRQHRIVQVDGHAQARSGRMIQCFLTCHRRARTAAVNAGVYAGVHNVGKVAAGTDLGRWALSQRGP